MIASGERMDFSGLSRPTADKHSTGGVGDKITLPLAPLVAACGVAVPQLSGRGLGHTGGTLDKLESIPGWRAALSNDEMLAQLEDVGAVICAAGAGLAPADQKLYALRDVTGTVEAIPLIAQLDHEQEDRRGHRRRWCSTSRSAAGAFMKDLDRRARARAHDGRPGHGRRASRTVALLTDMSTPLGLTAGNALEVRESVEVLAGGGPPDVVELTLALAREMLAGAGRADVDPADALADGRAMDAWRRMITRPGRRPGRRRCRRPARRTTVPAPADGVLTALDALAVGSPPGGSAPGRARKEDPVQAGAGVELHAKPGATVPGGRAAADAAHRHAGRFERALAALEGGYLIAPEGSRPDLLPAGHRPDRLT